MSSLGEATYLADLLKLDFAFNNSSQKSHSRIVESAVEALLQSSSCVRSVLLHAALQTEVHDLHSVHGCCSVRGEHWDSPQKKRRVIRKCQRPLFD
jgi:hypothetical protein